MKKRLISSDIYRGLIGHRHEQVLASESDTGKRLVHVHEIKGCFGDLITVDSYQVFSPDRHGERCQSFSDIGAALLAWDRV